MLKPRERQLPGPTYMSKEQMGQQPHISPFSLSDVTCGPPSLRKIVLEKNINSHIPITARYLSDLRSSKPSRPSGSRPPPPSRFNSLRRAETDLAEHVPLNDDRPLLPTSNSMPVMPGQQLLHRRTESDLTGFASRSPFAGRPLARPPPDPVAESVTAPQEPPNLSHSASMNYLENGTRWMEKQEAKSLRRALEDMDIEAERKVHAAAQDEAAELVWKHQYPDMPYANPDAPYPNPDKRPDYRSHLRKGSYQRSNSRDTLSTFGHRTCSDGSQKSNSDSISSDGKADHVQVRRKVSPPTGVLSMPKQRSASGKSYDGLAAAVAGEIANAHRRISSGSKRILSGSKRLAMHPDDRIWEDPSEGSPPRERQQPIVEPPKPSAPAVPSYVRKNPFARVRMQQDRMERSNSAPVLPTAPLLPTASSSASAARLDRVEIQRNPPSQSRNPFYTFNPSLPPTPPSETQMSSPDEVSPKVVPTRDGLEVRGDDIRSATSKQRKEYSPNLPRPTMVSDRPGRPIVSFQKRQDVVLEEVHTAAVPTFAPPVPVINVEEASKPPIPTLSFPDGPALPTINLPEEPDFTLAKARADLDPPTISVDPPSINISEISDVKSARDKRPQASWSPTRPSPHHAATAPVLKAKSTPHYTPSIRQSGVLCAHCALPIAGRILSAAGERFHPGCFVCHECSTNLECVAFYPEPERQREERLERISARQCGMEIPGAEHMSPQEMEQQEHNDGDQTLRFYCHLDFHELFSPRCKSCKTPIEGEVIVACGAEWHAGHFFCAQCGDPFDSTTPFVEKDGYAWCVGCHTNRYSPKCRKCKKPVTDVVVKALGADWHGACFVCMECNGEFDDGRYFLRGESQDPVCVRCEERRLKA